MTFSIEGIRRALLELKTLQEKMLLISQVKCEVAELLVRGYIEEPILVHFTDKGEWRDMKTERRLSPAEISQLESIRAWLETQYDYLKDLTTRESISAMPPGPDVKLESGTYMHKFRRECERRNLSKGETIDTSELYDIAEAIGMKDLPRDRSEFRPRNRAYQKARQYASLTGYKIKR